MEQKKQLKDIKDNKELEQEPLDYHEQPIAGKFKVVPTKAMNNQKDLSLAYSPGVAVPCIAIRNEPETAYKYTNKGNMVAVISNGTAVLGLGNLGALASKPVMEGKAVLFNKFAGVQSIDICVDEKDPEKLINVVKALGPSFGGINLEDIKGPDCFKVEQELKKLMDIPVFHDDQHGTAIVCLAGLINSVELSGKKFEDIKIVVNGAGAAGIACLNLMLNYGAKLENCYLCDSKGIIYKGRTEGVNEWKTQLANDTSKRTLAEAVDGADVFVGVSAPGALTQDMVKTMAKDPVIFAMANPEPEIRPEVAKAVRDDVIIATGRSDYPNQVNNVMCFPFLFRAALDTRASQINEAMKMAAAKALAHLAREKVPEEVSKAYDGRKMEFGREYIIPTPFDPRLIEFIPAAVAKAAIDSGVAKIHITDWEAYKKQVKARQNPSL